MTVRLYFFVFQEGPYMKLASRILNGGQADTLALSKNVGMLRETIVCFLHVTKSEAK